MNLAQLRLARGKAADELTKLAAEGGEAYDAKKREIEELDAKIARLVEAEKIGRASATPVDPANPGNGHDPALVPARSVEVIREYAPIFTRMSPGGVVPRNDFDSLVRAARSELGITFDAQAHFRSFGEQLQAIAAASNPDRSRQPDARLVRAPLGAGEVDPTSGGFLVQTDIAQAVFSLAHDMGEILSRVTRLPISANSSGIKIPAVDETSRATGSRWGGVQSYWVDEGTGVTATKPKFRVIELSLKKLMSTMYTTDELLADQTALTAIASQAFAEEITFMTEDAVFEGSGAGQPLGILNAPATVSVPKEVGQAAATVVLENINKMYSRMWSRSRRNAVWLINQDIEPQLNALGQTVGVGGMPVYLPPGGYQNAPNATLLGRPVIATEYSSALGSVGDISLVDLSQYLLADKGGVQAATSMHVAFLTDQMTFRITYRVDGRPIWNKALTPFKGTLTKTPFVTLAAR